MRIRLLSNGFELVSQNAAEAMELEQLFKKGHVHLVCKAFGKSGRQRRHRLFLTASLFPWVMRKPAVARRRRARG